MSGFNETYNILIDLCHVPSVSPNGEMENRAVNLIYEKLKKNRYFQNNPEHLRELPIPHDELGRNILFAIVKSQEKTARTVILTGHLDVVEKEGPLKDLIFDPEEYTRKIVSVDIPNDAKLDADSGGWLFGRGTADMKSGVAAATGYALRIANGEIALSVNLVLLFVPDEENDSRGMLGAISWIKQLSESMDLDYIACINTEPSVAPVNGGAVSPAIYLGSIGKINPFLYVIGKRMHLGEYFKGISASLLASYININIEGNLDLGDVSGENTYLPIGCHIIKNIQQTYSASVADRVFLLYGYMPVSKFPDQILIELMDLTRKSLGEAISHIEKIQHRYIKNETDINHYEPEILLFSQLRTMYCEKFGSDGDRQIRDILLRQSAGTDARTRSLEIVTEMVDALAIKGPTVIIGYMFPCYPFIENRKTDPRDVMIKQIAEDVVRFAKNKYGRDIQIHEFFEGASDLSYCGLRGRAEAYAPYYENVPGWGDLYEWPIDDMAMLDFPVLNIGSLGKDLHKYTERVEVEYTTVIVPDLLDLAVREISEKLL